MQRAPGGKYIMESTLLVLIFLFVISIIDFKWKAIPSVIMTGFLFIIAAVNTTNFFYFGLLTIFGILLYEFKFIGGVADIKALSIVGFTIASHLETFIFILLVTFFGLLYKILAKYILREREETAFLIVFFFSYLCLKLIMNIMWGGNWI